MLVVLLLGAELQLGQQQTQAWDLLRHVELPRLVLLVHGLHLGAELQLGQRLPQDLDLPRHVELVHDFKLLVLLDHHFFLSA